MCKCIIGVAVVLPLLFALLTPSWRPQHSPFIFAASAETEPRSRVPFLAPFAEVSKQSLIPSSANGVSDLQVRRPTRSKGREHHRTAARNSSRGTGKLWFPGGSVAPDNAPEDAAELRGSIPKAAHEEIRMQREASNDDAPLPALPRAGSSPTPSFDNKKTRDPHGGEKTQQSAEKFRDKRDSMPGPDATQEQAGNFRASPRGLEERLRRRYARDRKKALKVEARWKVGILFVSICLQILDSYIFIYREYYDRMTVARSGGTRTLGTLSFRFFHHPLVFYSFLARNILSLWQVLNWLNEYHNFDYSAVLPLSRRRQPVTSPAAAVRKE